MSRQELVAAATAAGIAKASSTKSEDLVKALAKTTKVKATKAGGTGKKGRPIVEGSARQLREAAKAARAVANGGIVKRGRPAKPKAEAAQEDQAG
jgi:hypothetical protein